MRICVVFSIIAAFAMMTAGCRSAVGISSVGVETFAHDISGRNVQLVDVRTPQEYAEGHIQSAININVQSPSFEVEALKALKKNSPVYVYCRSGKRSMMAAEQLVKVGYRVINLEGGILGWMEAGLPTK